MSEDALVNTGAVGWPDEGSAAVAVRRMQTKLYGWAGADSSRRFDDLFNLIYDRSFLMYAWERVSTNTGARTAGVDRATVAWIETQIGVVAFLEAIREALKSGTYRPVEVRRVAIPKGSSGKLRKLGIPTVTDRVVQTVLKEVLEPISRRISCRVRMGFVRNGVNMTRSPRFTVWRPDPRSIIGFWRLILLPVSMRSGIRRF
jgi:RNA-directed DNA polymerase